MKYCSSNPYKSLSKNEILAELSESRMSYDGGEGEELSKVISEIGEKYDLKMQRDKYVQKILYPWKKLMKRFRHTEKDRFEVS